MLRGAPAVLAACFLAGGAFGQSVPLAPDVYHTPVLSAAVGEEIEIRLSLEESAREATAVLLWRLPGGEFRESEFYPVVGGLACAIPSADVQPPRLEYAILARLPDGRELSYPLNNPLISPQIIAVAGLQIPPSPGPRFVVLYPQEGSIVYEEPVRLSISVFDSDSLYDPATLELWLDGRALRPEAATGTYIFAQASGLSPGRHVVIVKSRTYSGVYNPDFRWSFSTASRHKASSRANVAWSFLGETSLDGGIPAAGSLKSFDAGVWQAFEVEFLRPR